MSSTPHISRIECIDSCGAPTSTVRQPRLEARIGPMVEPHAMSLRTLNSWAGMPRRLPTSLHMVHQSHHYFPSWLPVLIQGKVFAW